MFAFVHAAWHPHPYPTVTSLYQRFRIAHRVPWDHCCDSQLSGGRRPQRGRREGETSNASFVLNTMEVRVLIYVNNYTSCFREEHCNLQELYTSVYMLPYLPDPLILLVNSSISIRVP